MTSGTGYDGAPSEAAGTGTRTRRFGYYAVLVALPAALAVAGAGWIHDAELQRLSLAESAAVARTALEVIGPVEEEGGRDPLEPAALVTLLEASLGYESAVFRGTERVVGSDPGFGSDSTLIPYLELAEPGAHVDVKLDDRWAALASDTADATSGRRAVLVTRSSPRRTRTGLLGRWWLPPAFLLFTLLLGWLLLPGPKSPDVRARIRCWAAALTPALVVVAGLFALDGELIRDGRQARIRQLTLASVVVREAAENAPIEEIRRIAGFPATKLSSRGAVLAASEDAPDRRVLQGLPTPPSTRTITGELEGPSEQWQWVARRDAGAGATTLVLLRPADSGDSSTARLRILVLALSVLAAALGFQKLWSARRAPPVSESAAP